jgi:hypothetical protein
MSLDNIVKIHIDTQSLSMSQTGFGTPLIIAKHDHWTERVRSFSNLSELFKASKAEKFELEPLYKMVQTIFAQTPTVPKIKIGKRIESESVEVALKAISKSDADGDFYGILVLSENDPAKDYLSLADAVSSRRLLAGVDIPEGKTELGEALANSLGARRIFSIYNAKEGQYPAAAWMGRMLSQAPGSSSWAFKSLEGIEKAKLSTDTTDKLKATSINRHIDINKVGVTLDGKVAKGEYIDVIHGIDWLHVRIQERLFRLLQINEKIPYTAKGIDLVRCEIMAQLKEAVNRGLLAPEPEPQVSIPNIEDVSESKRRGRILPDVHFSGRLAGAIHEIEIKGVVN